MIQPSSKLVYNPELNFNSILLTVVDVWDTDKTGVFWSDDIIKDIDIFAPYLNQMLELYQEKGAHINIFKTDIAPHPALDIKPNLQSAYSKGVLEYCIENEIDKVILVGCHTELCILDNYYQMKANLNNHSGTEVYISANLCRPIPYRVGQPLTAELNNDSNLFFDTGEKDTDGNLMLPISNFISL
jgi:hypothetical protein